MKILGIESSCDETAAALLDAHGSAYALRANVVFSQIAIHAKTGGVVPEVAARNHVMSIIPVIKKACGKERPDCIAVTAGPGLVTSLSVGVHTARCLGYLWDVPLVAVNHIEGHLYANWFSSALLSQAERPRSQASLKPSGYFTLFRMTDVKFPALALIVSGGHTELVFMRNHGKYKKIGQTLDDAAGEAFDKAAKILDLGYPGGPAVSLLAEQGDAARFDFPRALRYSKERPYDFSFSGLKTSLLYCVRDLKASKKYSRRLVPHLCASFQEAVVDVLVAKTVRAAKRCKIKSILLGGGVVANTLLRERMRTVCEHDIPDIALHMPELRYCADNAAMIAMDGYFHAKKKDFTPWQKIDVRTGWSL